MSENELVSVACPHCGLDWDGTKCEYCDWDGSIEEVVERLSPIDNLKFRALDAEVRNHQQGIRLAEFRLQEITRNYHAQVAKENHEISVLKAAYKTDHAEYVAFITEIAEARELDPTQIAIDPITAIIRDLRN